LLVEIVTHILLINTGWYKKLHKVYGTVILQLYVSESCGFQQNVPKVIFYMTEVSVWIQRLNIFCFWCWQVNYSKTVLPSTSWSMKTCHFFE